MDNLYLVQAIEEIASGHVNLTDLVPNGIVLSLPEFYDDAAVNVSSANYVRALHDSLTHARIPSVSLCCMPSSCVLALHITCHATCMPSPAGLSSDQVPLCLLQGVSVTSAFINYAPCIIAQAAQGISIGPSAVNVQPVGLFVNPEGEPSA